MKHRRILSLGLAAVLLTSCGSDTETAADPSGQRTGSPDPSPTAAPTTGSYPAYPYSDYDFTLRISCFCPDAGSPLRVSVRDGEVESVIYARKGRGHAAGDPVAGEWQRQTLNDVITAANDTEADRVEVDWPAGQEYPSSVYVDRSFQAIDEEVGYTVSNVVPAKA